MFSRISLAILAFSFVPITVAMADDESSAETVVVTASRVPVPTDQSGSAITVIDGAKLAAEQIPTIFDALRTVPGVAVSRTGILGSFSEIRIRGAEANQTLVLIDGVEANDPAASDEFNFAHLMSAGIARVEILRGPQSALWGADALAGVVNIITVAPREGFYASGRAEGGSFGTREVSGIVNAGARNYGAVVDADYLKSDGINIAQTGHEKDGYENTSIDARGFVDLAPNIVLSANVRHVNGNDDFDSGFPLPVDSPDFTEAAFTYGRAQAKATFLGGALELILGANLTQTRSDDFASTTFNFQNIKQTDSIDGAKIRFDAQSNLFWSGDAFGYALDQRLSVLAQTTRETFKQREVFFPDANQNQHTSSQALAAEYGLSIGNAAFLSLGLRHDSNDRFADSNTWRSTISIPWRAFDARLHASAGTGVKNPDFFELFGFEPSNFIGNQNLKPEKSLGFDAGAEKYFFERALRLDVTYYNADLENEIYTDFSVFPNTARNGVGKSRRNGIEVSAAADLGNGFTLNAVYTYANSTANGAQELRRPHSIAALDADYRFAGGRAFLNLGVDLHGSQKDTDFVTFETVTLHSYTLVHLAGSYDLGNGLAVTARIENALNQHYEEVFGYRTEGFGAFAGLDFKIGS
jgi:vitamin B12 transporter